jgi:hypothetical protein
MTIQRGYAPRPRYNDLITRAAAGDVFVIDAGAMAYAERARIKRQATRMGMIDGVMVWAERGNVYIARRAA